MKAMVQRGYGAPNEVLALEDRPIPTVEDDGVLVRVTSASVNTIDWRRVRGAPSAIRLEEGLGKPKDPGLGRDASGRVEAVGSEVRHLRVGDEVFGVGPGAFGEYVQGRTFVPKPTNLTHEQAAAIPVAGLTALQGLRDHGNVTAGKHVLVHGAGGGVGTFAVQIARALGAEVTATTSGTKMDLVESLGADRVVDHTAAGFDIGSSRYDVVMDVGGRPSIRECLRAVAPGGVLVLVGAGHGVGGPVGRMAAGVVRQRVLRQPVRWYLSEALTEDLLTLRAFAEAGELAPVIDRTFPLSSVPEALSYVESGGARGKVAISV